MLHGAACKNQSSKGAKYDVHSVLGIFERPACLRASAPRVQECFFFFFPFFFFVRVQKAEHLAGDTSAQQGWKKRESHPTGVSKPPPEGDNGLSNLLPM